MQFDSNNINKSPEQHLVDELHESMTYLYRMVTNLDSIDPGTIRRLAIELRKILIDEIEGSENRNCLFDEVLKEPSVPYIYSINDTIDSFYNTYSSVLKDAGIKRKNAKSKLRLGFSMGLYDGVYRPLINLTKTVDIKCLLETQILALPTEEMEEGVVFTVRDVIYLVSCKDVAHVDVSFIQNPKLDNEIKFSLLYKLRERFLLIVGLIEYVIFVYSHITKTLPEPQVNGEDNRRVYSKYYHDDGNVAVAIEPSLVFFNSINLPTLLIDYVTLRDLSETEEADLFGFSDDIRLFLRGANKEFVLSVKGDEHLLS